MDKATRATNEVKDALAFGDVATLAALAPLLNALKQTDQVRILGRIVEAGRVDFVRAVSKVDWKVGRWKDDALIDASRLGFVDIVKDLAPEVPALSLRYALTYAAFNPSRGQEEVVRFLAPLAHAAGQPMSHAIRDAVLSMTQSAPTRPARTEASYRILPELFRFERVEVAIKHMLATEYPDWHKEHLPLLARFLDTQMHSCFIERQAAMKTPRTGPWRTKLASVSPDCDRAVAALQAHCAALALTDRLPVSIGPTGKAPSRRL